MTVTLEHLGRNVWAATQNGIIYGRLIEIGADGRAGVEQDYMYLIGVMADRVFLTREEAEGYARRHPVDPARR